MLTYLCFAFVSKNELAIMEFIHCVVETMDRYFGNVCELDIMFHIEKVRGSIYSPQHFVPLSLSLSQHTHMSKFSSFFFFMTRRAYVGNTHSAHSRRDQT